MLPGLAGASRQFLAGAARVDVSPRELPVIVNCYMTERVVDKLREPLFAKALVLDDGATRLAIVIVDSCMMPRELIDKARVLVPETAGVKPENMLIAATHTHFAPAAMACLGSDEQPGYAAFLSTKIAEVITEASKRLEPARVGWASVQDTEHTFNRRWIYQKGKELTDPFGGKSVRANMHPGYQNPNAVGPSGPVDAELSVLAVKSKSGKPLAILANYAMHYFNDQPVSSDYFAHFYRRFAGRISAPPDFVAIMSQGTSGDLATLDYSRPKANEWTIEQYADGVAASAERAYRAIRYKKWAPLGVESSFLDLNRRIANQDRLTWAREMVEKMGGRKPKNQPEVYAREQLLIAGEPKRQLRIQALRIGDLGIGAMPNEVFALTGLKIKARSPFSRTFNIELANGAEGYIPPPEQHRLGGYTTWAARSAGLETGAEPRIANEVLVLMEKLAGRPRRAVPPQMTRERKAALRRKPVAYFPLDDMDGNQPANLIPGEKAKATLIPGYALYLEGQTGQAVHFAGGRLNLNLKNPAPRTRVEFSIWNGLKPAPGTSTYSQILSADGLSVDVSDGELRINMAPPSAILPSRIWTRLAVESDTNGIRLFVNGVLVETLAPSGRPLATLRFGAGFEGKIDEIAIYQ